MLLLFVAALVVQVVCWAVLGWGLARIRPPETGLGGEVPVSVVVAARDEEGRLPTLLDALAEQTHTAFEAVVVDDASEDGTCGLVESRAARDPRFRLVRVDEAQHPELPRKKRALTLGIAAARHDRLAFTDADCAPPPGWLAALADHAAREPDAVLVGYGPYRAAPGTLNAFVRYETFLTALLTAAAIGLGRPFMAVGRNFSYPKSLFERLGGFAHQAHSLSGDDDLLVQEAHRHGAPVRYVLDPGAFVPSEPPGSWRQWLRQKLRHTSAGRHYARGPQVGLAVFHASALAVWVAPVFLGWTGAALLAGRFLVQRAVLRRAAEAFALEPGLLAAQPLLDLGYALYNTFVAPLGALRTPRAW